MASRLNDAEPSDCPICLSQMTASEEIFVLPCQNCDFNYCSKCVGDFLRSSQDDYGIASDGSRQVKIHVACPQCRSKYPMDIDEVIRLRKVHGLGLAIFDDEGTPRHDSDLKATDLALKNECHTRRMKRKTEMAHVLYLKVMGAKADKEQMTQARIVSDRVFQGLPEAGEDDSESDEESKPESPRIKVDCSMFQGLHDFLGYEEKVYITELYSSGEAARVAQGAMILHGVLQVSMQPPSARTARPASMERNWREEKKLAEMLDKTKKAFPLPNHMPGYFLVETFPSRKQYLSFHDEKWDGTITPPSNLKQIFTHVYGDSYQPANKENPRPIVTISGVRGPAGRVGLRKGDVVTHINEVEWTGTAAELLEHIHKLNEHEQTISITVNASPETATFLQARKRLMEKSKTFAA